MAKYPPYMNSYGRIKTVLEKIKSAATPDRFTYDFLETKLGAKGGSARTFVGFAKRLKLLNSDGTPTDLYHKFRNSASSGAAMAEAMRNGYDELYQRNEYAHELSRPQLEGLIVEVTGLEKKHKTVKAIASSFEALKEYADFDASPVDLPATTEARSEPISGVQVPMRPSGRDFDLNVAYTINLVLPKTDDVSVFDAIFRSLRTNLLGE